MAENKEPKRFFGVNVNRDTVKKATNLAEFKKANPNIFDHLGDNEAIAYAQLWDEVKPDAAAVSKAPEPLPAK